MTTCVPTERLVVVALVAIPPVTVAGVPKATPSTLNCTVPVEFEGDTVAANETASR